MPIRWLLFHRGKRPYAGPVDISAFQRAGFTAYAVGQPYDPATPVPMPETPHLRITGSHLELTVSYRGPTQHEIEQFTRGKVRFAWVDSEQVAVLAFKFGDMPWADCPFHPKLVVDAGMEPPNLPTGEGKVLPMIFVDGSTGLVASIRLIGLPADFVTAMSATVSRMMSFPYDIAAHDTALDALYDRYPTPAVMVRDRADVTCLGAVAGSTLPGTGVDAN